jgi:3-deoxy-D-manno-octulosonic-acid transferase
MIFVQDEESQSLIKNIVDENKVTVAGDTRYDRVLTIANNRKQLPVIESFINNNPVLIAGSTWLQDENILQQSFRSLPADWKLIIAPHEIDRVAEIQKLFPEAILYSSLTTNNSFADKRILIIDNMGILSSLYYYGKIAFVGGGFNKGGIHNILEPAVFGLPVIIGPVYKKFIEANLLVQKGFCFSINNADECKALLARLSADEIYYQNIHQSLSEFMKGQVGASEKILSYINSLL